MEALRTVSVLVAFVTFLVVVSAKNIVENGEIEVGIYQRLRAIEATLDIVLKKNDQLEQRVTALELENSELKATVDDLQYQVQETYPCGTDGVETKENEPKEPSSKIQENKIVALESSQIKPKRQLHIVPSTVAFTAVVNPPSLTNLGAGQTIIYDRVVTNIGGAYHNTTGVFTAPFNGVYVFNFALMIDPGKDEYLVLVKNGHPVIANYGHGTGSVHLASSSRTATMELKAGDEVWVQTSQSSHHGTGQIHGNGYTTFSGWINDFLD